jgi:hypothetical protein
MWKEAVKRNMRYYPGILLKKHKKFHEKQNSEDRRCPCRDSNQSSPEYKSEPVTLEPTC